MSSQPRLIASTMIDDKKRKPSRDFPAHAAVPTTKSTHTQHVHNRVRVDLQPTAAASVPRMPDPHNILHYPSSSSSQHKRSESMLSTGSRISMISMDDNFELAGDEPIMEDEEFDESRASLPKHARPPQPADEREYFEKLWAANFERSEAQVANTTAFIPAGAAGRLNRIKGFSFARDTTTHRLYAVFRLEIECIEHEKQWTIYRRFHDFKQLAHQLKTQGVRLTPVPTRTLMRSLDTNFLKKRQLELDRWLREVLMLVSLENCKVDTEKHSECGCGNKGFHASCRIIRQFLTHSANQPPAFESVEVAHTTSASMTSSSARPPLHSVSDGAATTGLSSSSSSSSSYLSMHVGGFRSFSSSASRNSFTGPTNGGAARTSFVSTRDVDLLSSSIRDSDMIGSYAESTTSSLVNPAVPQEGDDDDHQSRRLSRTSVVVEDLDDHHNVVRMRRDGRVSLQDFDVLRLIGRGSFGKVLLVRKKHTSQLFAVKILSKSSIVKKQQVEHTRTERRVLASVAHPFVVALHYAFQTKDKLFFVLDYCPGGDLFFHLSRCGCFPESMARFYTAEIVLALIHLHEQGIVYRDLKPENIMLDVDGHVKLADFGLAKEGITSEIDGTYTMCGTPEYLPPEILNRQGHGTAVDWWNLGMVLYEMLTGRPPWYTQDREELFARLRDAKLEFPEGMSVEAMDLIEGLLTRDPAKRLGAMDPRELTYHPFFAEIDWNLLYHREMQPLYRPCQYTDPIDAANFEEEFTKLPLGQIESDGLSIASEAPRHPSTASAVANGTRATAGESMGGSSGQHQNRGGAGGAGSVGGRKNTLRNMSYTFAGFTYEGASLARSTMEPGGASLDEYEASMGSHHR